jgi:DNA polymerase-3 subunit epsilon
MIRNKGNFVSQELKDFTVIDLETTGLSTDYDEIIEIAAYKVRNGIIIDKYETLVNPGFEIFPFIEELTGITNEMLQDQPSIDMVIQEVYDFIKDEVLLGHNVHFDLNFLYDALYNHLGVELSNDYTDTLRITRKVFPELTSHRLKTLNKELELKNHPTHRATTDVIATIEIYEICKRTANEKGLTFEELFTYQKSRVSDIRDGIEIKDDASLNGEVFVFTGTLEKMDRKAAWKLVLENGGEIGDNVTKKTNYLVLGNADYHVRLNGGKSSKMKKAEDLILKGADLEIISENVFYEMINI